MERVVYILQYEEFRSYVEASTAASAGLCVFIGDAVCPSSLVREGAAEPAADLARVTERISSKVAAAIATFALRSTDMVRHIAIYDAQLVRVPVGKVSRPWIAATGASFALEGGGKSGALLINFHGRIDGHSLA